MGVALPISPVNIKPQVCLSNVVGSTNASSRSFTKPSRTNLYLSTTFGYPVPGDHLPSFELVSNAREIDEHDVAQRLSGVRCDPDDADIPLLKTPYQKAPTTTRTLKVEMQPMSSAKQSFHFLSRYQPNVESGPNDINQKPTSAGSKHHRRPKALGHFNSNRTSQPRATEIGVRYFAIN